MRKRSTEQSTEQPMDQAADAPRSDKKGRNSQEMVQHAPRGSLLYRNFDEFWFKLRSERNLDDKWKMPLLAHFKAAGFNSPEKYEEGLRHFGL